MECGVIVIAATLGLKLLLVWIIFLNKCLKKAYFVAGAVLKHFPCKSFKKNLLGGWNSFDAFSFTNLLGKARLKAGAGWKHFPLRIR